MHHLNCITKDIARPQTAKEVRSRVSEGLITGPTSGMAPGYVQANLVILPVDWAFDFFLFAQRNPKPCPIIEAGDMGNPFTKFCADGADIRTDIPKYRVYRDGEITEELTDIKELWQDDFVYFLLGCSFSFENALIKADLKIRHMEENVNVPMYITNIMCNAAGEFKESPMVVRPPLMITHVPGHMFIGDKKDHEFKL